jgi:hypothetical protein
VIDEISDKNSDKDYKIERINLNNYKSNGNVKYNNLKSNINNSNGISSVNIKSFKNDNVNKTDSPYILNKKMF